MTLQHLRDSLNEKFLERSDLVDGLLVALLAKEPLFMLGPPGTAKSAICETLCSAIGGKYFSWMMNKFTVTEELFGPLSLRGLEEDRYSRVMTGKLPEADLAFLDECFKGSSAILNTLLTISNERVFFNDGKRLKVPLQTLFAASNEIPDAEELSAFYDRFVLRYYVEPVKTSASVMALFSGFAEVKMPSITLADLAAEQNAASAVSVDSVVDPLVKLRREVETAGLMVSDRKWVQSVRCVKASAHLNGRTVAEADDLSIYQNILWSKPEQRAQVRKMVLSLANPQGEKILAILDGIRDLEQSLSSGKMDVAEAFKKTKTASDMLKKLRSNRPDKTLDQAIEEAMTLQRRIAKEHLGLE